MIKYSLECAKGHVFDEWFDNMADYDKKLTRKALACPECGSKKVQKSLMAPNLKTSGRKDPPAMPAMPCGGGACSGGLCPMARE